MDLTRLQQLFTLFYSKAATDEERAELMMLVQQATPAELQSLLMEQDPGTIHGGFSLEPGKAEAILQTILSPQVGSVPVDKYGPATAYRKVARAVNWWRYAAAASVILFIVAAGYIFSGNNAPEPVLAIQKIQPVNDVKAPDQNRAMITLANGKVIYLDSVNNGTIAREGDVEVLKQADGQIVYDNPGVMPVNSALAYNSLHNPSGSNVINMVLADGSKVWLNAASSLTYPVAFSTGERKVTITGEAYFEVAKNVKPFRVQFNETVVEVLGTHFNINAYTDEPSSKTTLLEGAIKISNSTQQKILHPGSQAEIYKEQWKVNNDVDTAEAVAWKNKYFQFTSADIATIMRQTARWYNIQVSYQGAIPADRFSGKISRAVNLSEFLKVLQYSEVNFKIEGRKIIVLP